MKPLFYGSSGQLTTQGFPYDSSKACDPPVKGLHPLLGNGPNKLSEWAQKAPKYFQNIGRNSSPSNSSHHGKENERVTTNKIKPADVVAPPCNPNIPMTYNIHSCPVVLTNSHSPSYDPKPSTSHGLDSKSMLMPSTPRLSTTTVPISSPWGSQSISSPRISLSSRRPGSLRSTKSPNPALSPNPHSSIDLIDACFGYSQERPNSARDRVKAVGMRIFGEDVADRNMLNLQSDQMNRKQEQHSTIIDNNMSNTDKESYFTHKQAKKMMTDLTMSPLTPNQPMNAPQSVPSSFDLLDNPNTNQKISLYPQFSSQNSWPENEGNHITRPSTAHARLDYLCSSSPESSLGSVFDHNLGLKSKSLSLPRPCTSRQTQKTSYFDILGFTKNRNNCEKKSVDKTQPSRDCTVSRPTEHLTSQSVDLRTTRSKMAPGFVASRSYSTSLISSGINNNLSSRDAAKKKSDLVKEHLRNDSAKSLDSKKSFDTFQPRNFSNSILTQQGNNNPVGRKFPSSFRSNELEPQADILLPDDKTDFLRDFQKSVPANICNIKAGSHNVHIEHSNLSIRQSHSTSSSKPSLCSYSYSNTSSTPSTPHSLTKEPLCVIPERHIADSPLISIGRAPDFPAKSIHRAADPPVISNGRAAESPVIAKKNDRNNVVTSDSHASARKYLFSIRFGLKDHETLPTLNSTSKSSKYKTTRKASSFSHDDSASRFKYNSFMTDVVSNEREYDWHSPRPSTMMGLEDKVGSLGYHQEISAALTSAVPKSRSLSLSSSLFSHAQDGQTLIFNPHHHLHQYYDESSNNSDEDYLDDNLSYEIMSSPPVPDGEELLFHDDIYGTDFGGMLPGLCIQSPMFICQPKQ